MIEDRLVDFTVARDHGMYRAMCQRLYVTQETKSLVNLDNIMHIVTNYLEKKGYFRTKIIEIIFAPYETDTKMVVYNEKELLSTVRAYIDANGWYWHDGFKFKCDIVVLDNFLDAGTRVATISFRWDGRSAQMWLGDQEWNFKLHTVEE